MEEALSSFFIWFSKSCTKHYIANKKSFFCLRHIWDRRIRLNFWESRTSSQHGSTLSQLSSENHLACQTGNTSWPRQSRKLCWAYVCMQLKFWLFGKDQKSLQNKTHPKWLISSSDFCFISRIATLPTGSIFRELFSYTCQVPAWQLIPNLLYIENFC